MRRPVTLQTIADEVGVSKQTVSNAFARPDQLSDGLRERILETAARRGYGGPDPRGRALSRGRTGVIGVVLTERSADAITDPAATEFLAGVAEALEDGGRNMLLVSGRPDSSPGFSPIADAAVDGLIMYSLSPADEHVVAARQRGIPLVTVDQPELDDHPFVGVDQWAAGALAAGHLVELGHASIAVLAARFCRDGQAGLASPRRVAEAEFPLTVRRLSGISDTAGTVAAVWECPDRSVVAAAVRYIVEETKATAIVAMSDVFALEAIAQLASRGVRVPEDFSVIGIDDTPAALVAGLSTVRQDHRAKGRLAVAAVIDGGAPPQLDMSLTARSSTARLT